MKQYLITAVALMLFTTTSIAETAKKVTHKHGVRSHTHVLPKISGLSHKHNGVKATPKPTASRPVITPGLHYHGTRSHAHPLPVTSYYHKHGQSQYGSIEQATTVKLAVKPAKEVVSTIPKSARYKCSEISRAVAKIFLASGHNYLDRDNDGDPCEPHNFPDQKPYKAPVVSSSSGSNCHWVSGYRRKSGSYVRGHTRCR